MTKQIFVISLKDVREKFYFFSIAQNMISSSLESSSIIQRLTIPGCKNAILVYQYLGLKCTLFWHNKVWIAQKPFFFYSWQAELLQSQQNWRATWLDTYCVKKKSLAKKKKIVTHLLAIFDSQFSLWHRLSSYPTMCNLWLPVYPLTQAPSYWEDTPSYSPVCNLWHPV